MSTGNDALAPETVRVRVDDRVATVVLARPERRNALTRRLGQDLLAALRRLGDDEQIGVVVLTGAGDSFCAGADLIDLDTDRLGELMTELNSVIETLRAIPQPVVGKVRGPAVGAGCNLALACDFVIADETACFAELFARMGLSPDLGGSWILPRLVGLRQARELALLGDDVDGATAARIGLIHQCVPAGALDSAVDELVGRLAARSRAGQARTKRLLDAAWTSTLADALAREADAQLANMTNPEFQEAVSRFAMHHEGAES